MKNYILEFDAVEVENFIINNFTEPRFLPATLAAKTEYYTYVEVEDNKKIEYISYDLYGTSEYWDIVLALNNMRDPLSLPKSLDFIINKVKKQIEDYMKYYKIQDPQIGLDKYDEEIEKEQKLNEQFRMVKVVKPEKLVDFLRDLRKTKIN